MKQMIITYWLGTILPISAITQQDLTGMTPYALFGLLERTKIAAFSTDSFIKSGTDAHAVALWKDLTYQCNQLALHEIKKSEILTFSRYLSELDAACTYILETTDALHKGAAPRTAARAQKLLLNMFMIETECFAEICKHAKPGSDWTAQIPHGAILSGIHQKILDGYVAIAKQAEQDGHPVRDRELLGLLKLYQTNIKSAVTALINNLEQYCYKKEKFHTYARALINDLKAQFPGILSSYELNLLAHTKDKPNLIIFTQAGAYENILHQILREL
jgi:hypothetical protein